MAGDLRAQGALPLAADKQCWQVPREVLIGRPLPRSAPQTGAKGKPVNTLYIANKMKLKREMYFAILLDRSTAGPVMIGCSEVGGTG